VCDSLHCLGIKIDLKKNEEEEKKGRDISHTESRVKVFVIPTSEEKEIAQQVITHHSEKN